MIILSKRDGSSGAYYPSLLLTTAAMMMSFCAGGSTWTVTRVIRAEMSGHWKLNVYLHTYI
jgi:hypothetical protein